MGYVVPLSAMCADALSAYRVRIAEFLDECDGVQVVDVATTLAVGREPMNYREAVVADDVASLITSLRSAPVWPPFVAPRVAPSVTVVFDSELNSDELTCERRIAIANAVMELGVAPTSVGIAGEALVASGFRNARFAAGTALKAAVAADVGRYARGGDGLLIQGREWEFLAFPVDDSRSSMLRMVAALWRCGVIPDATVMQQRGRRLHLPAYPFQRRSIALPENLAASAASLHVLRL